MFALAISLVSVATISKQQQRGQILLEAQLQKMTERFL
jgi:hypothetical protein